MPGASRTVRKLRLRAPSEAGVRRAAIALEDALRTASLPDGGGRMLFVRRLALGRIDPSAPPTSMARALERALAQSDRAWRHGADPGAGSAGGVWFRDPLDAHLALAFRLLSGPAPGEWYWARAVPGWRAGFERATALREIAFSLAGREEAAAALPQWFATLVRSGHGPALLAAFREGDLAPLARAAGIRFEPVNARGTTASECGGEGVAGHPSRTAALSQERAEYGTEQATERAARRLIAAMLHAAGPVPGSGISSELGQSRPERLPKVDGRAAAASRASGAADASATGDARGSEATGHRPGAVAQPDTPTLPADGSASNAEALEERTARPGPTTASTPVGGTDPTTGSTDAGGLLFLLNALTRIGYGDWVAEQPVWAGRDVARRVLARVLTRLDIPANDPAWALVETRPSAAHPRRFIAPVRWRQGLMSGAGALRLSLHGNAGRLHDASGRLLLGAWVGPRPRALLADCRRGRALPDPRPAGGSLDEQVVEAWLVALRRWLRRYAHIGLADLVRRPGRLSLTPTHLDVEFDLAGADLRLRRAGLDLDPGWVPWFARVTAFHYGSMGEA